MQPLPLYPFVSKMTPNSLTSCFWVLPFIIFVFLLAGSIIQFLIPSSPPPHFSMKPWLGLEPLDTLWTMAKISCQFLWPCLNKDTECISLCSAVESHQHDIRRLEPGEGPLLKNNLIHGCSCHVGLQTVIYFRLPRPSAKLPVCCSEAAFTLLSERCCVCVCLCC